MIFFIAAILSIALACVLAARIVARTPPAGPKPIRRAAKAWPVPNRRMRRQRDSHVAHPPTSKLRECGHWGRR